MAVQVAGRARLGRRTKELVKRLTPADIAVIAHRDLDRVSADDLVAARVAAVINTQPCSTGAYPNAGPLLLAEAAIPLIECLDTDLFTFLTDGDPIAIRPVTPSPDDPRSRRDRAGSPCGLAPHRAVDIVRRGRVVARGLALDPELIAARHAALRAGVGAALERSRATRSSGWSRSESC